MIKNYLKIAFRNLRRNKVYTVINVLGLAVGITGAVLLYLYIDSELSYDRFHDKSDRIYRIVEISESQGQETRYFGQTAPILGTTLEQVFPEVENMVRIYQPRGHVDMEWKGERLHERNYLMADSTFFDLFDFRFIKGEAETALNQPNSVVISMRKAEQLFGNTNPIGKVLTFNNLGENTITAVVENPPDNSHLQFDMLFSRYNSNLNWNEYLTSWESYGAYTYMLLEKSTELPAFKKKLETFISEQQRANENARNFYLQPVSEVYLNSAAIEFGIEAEKGNVFYIYVFSAIGIFLLLIAAINYMNLATALSAQRGKEIGIRKAAGASKWQLIGQFLAESIIIALLACVFSYFLIELLLPLFNPLTGKHFEITSESFAHISMVLLAISLLLGITSGSYPAFYLALTKPVRVLKSTRDDKGGNITLRKALVVVQFSLSIILIIGTLAIYEQLNYIRSADLGFADEHVVVVDINHGDVRSRFRTVKQEMATVAGVQNVAASSRVPGEWKSITQVFARSPQSGSIDSVQSYFMSFDEDMLELYDIKITAGSNFTGNKQADSLSVILNEAAVKALNIDDPIGSFINVSGSEKPMKVIGVTENFHYQSLHQSVAPLIVGYWANPIRVIDYFSVKLAGGDISQIVEDIKKVHRRFDPETAMEYHFLDQQIEQKYQADVRAGRLFAIGGTVTIFVACLGLFGLALFSTQRRIREIGIRKALGATVTQILMLLTTDFMKLVAVSFLVAVPVSWYLVHNWLQNFAYQAEIGISVFLIAGVGALTVSLLTVSYQSIKAALMDPVNSLRSE